jgi:periplasmic protein TonB
MAAGQARSGLAGLLVASLLLHLAGIIAIVKVAGLEPVRHNQLAGTVLVYLGAESSATPASGSLKPSPAGEHEAAHQSGAPGPAANQLPDRQQRTAVAPQLPRYSDRPTAATTKAAADVNLPAIAAPGVTNSPSPASASGAALSQRNSGNAASVPGVTFEPVPAGVGQAPVTARAAGNLAGATGLGGSGSAGQRSAGAKVTAASPAGAAEGRAAFQAKLRALIEAHKRYPVAARKLGREGSCQRRLVLSRDGTLQAVEALSSCGHPFLNEAANRAINDVGRYPPLPKAFSGEKQSFDVTITFSLATR